MGILLNLFAAQVQGQIVEPSEMVIISPEDIGNICTLDPTDINANFSFAPHRHENIPKAQKQEDGSIFDITYVNSCGDNTWPEEAKNAFQYTVDLWSLHVSSNIPIRVEATWEELDSGVLGSAGPTLLFAFDQQEIDEYFGDGYKPNTFYPIAQVSAATGIDYVSNYDQVSHDIEVNINCDYSNWYFGTDANPPFNQIDMVSVMLHEIGHGIGFVGSMRENTSGNTVSWGLSSNPVLPLIYDQFALDGSFEELIDEDVYTNGSGELRLAVTGRNGGVFFGSGEAEFANNYDRVKLYTPSSYNAGSSFSHLDQSTFSNTENALMRPSIDRQFAIHSPGPVFCGMLKDMGWPLGNACELLIDDPSEHRRPILSQPENGIKNESTTPLLSWNGNENSTYRVEISSDFHHTETLLSETVTGNEFNVLSGLGFETMYFWRVRYENNGETSNWSSTSRFSTMGGVPDPVTLLSPENGAENVSMRVELTWREAPGAESYRLQVSRDSEFQSMVVNRTVASTHFSLSQFLDYSQTYFWRVLAESQGGAGKWSDVYNFTTIIEQPDQVVLESPQHEEGQISIQPVFEWNESP